VRIKKEIQNGFSEINQKNKMKKVPTVHELRQQGYKVRVTHVRKFYRFDPRSGKKTQFFAPFQSARCKRDEKDKHPEAKIVEDLTEEFFLSGKGGETIVEIADSQHKELGKGVAVCSENDSYIKNYGVKKAVAIALRNMEANKDPYFHIRQFFNK
jgi:hypothetical protein